MHRLDQQGVEEGEGGTSFPVIRPVLEQDLEQIAAIYDHYVMTSTVTFHEEPLPVAWWRKRQEDIARLGLPFIVAVGPDGDVLGFALAAPWRQKRAYRFTVEDSIYLRAGATGSGLGGRLLGDLLARCRTSGVRQVVAALADEGAGASLALHRRFGFEEVGRLPDVGFKFGTWLGVVLLQKSLGD